MIQKLTIRWLLHVAFFERFIGEEKMTRNPFTQFLILLLAAICLASPNAAAPRTMRIDTPGSAFTAISGKAAIDDVPDGRRVKGKAFSDVTLVGELNPPTAKVAERNATRLELHFRTSPGGPTLLRIILPDGNKVELGLKGDFLADSEGKAFDFGDVPLKFYDHSKLKLVIRYPGGIDSQIDPGEFVLKKVSLYYPSKLDVYTQLPHTKPPLGTTNTGNKKIQTTLPVMTSHAIYETPRIDIGAGLNKRLDLCRSWASECGQPAADAFCILQGHRHAAHFMPELDIGETAIISNHQTCRDPGCDGFGRIECE
ncbi:hypothetical protein [Pseudomonas sp. NPDC089569]|uniref:hypothetical protein n=1 Tax=Pseudomonas sp. NPDC089569 TaxID=3390722 RepID=UPI003D03F212